jgi:hypothetical protein
LKKAYNDSFEATRNVRKGLLLKTNNIYPFHPLDVFTTVNRILRSIETKENPYTKIKTLMTYIIIEKLSEYM